MKNLIAFLVISISVVCLLQSCGNNDQPDFRPAKEYRSYNSNDSAAFCEIMKTAFGPNLDKVCDYYKMKLDSIPSWPSGTPQWQSFDDIKEYRITDLTVCDEHIYFDKIHYGEVSPMIWELDSLRTMTICAKGVGGDFPERKDKGKQLKLLIIQNTQLSTIPLDLFTIPGLNRMLILSNKNLFSLPKGIESLPPDDKKDKTIYKIAGNGLNGSAPSNLSRTLWLINNEYRSIDWEHWKDTDFGKAIKQKDNVPPIGPILVNNKISDNVPDYILSDTLALLYTVFMIGDQQDGYGLKGLPSDEERQKMKDEFCTNHPEYKQYLKSY